MYHKKINKECYKLPSSSSSLFHSANKFNFGIVYTLYSEKFNSLELGFAENNTILETKLLRKQFFLLDKKKGTKKQLNLLIKTLDEFGIRYSDNFNFRYSNDLVRHLSTLGWPVGTLLYKQRKIKKELLCA